MRYYKLQEKVAPFTPPALYVPSTRPLDKSVDLSHWFGPIENQESLGSCTGFGSTQWYSAWQVKHGKPWVEYSELAQYWEERYDEGTVTQDSGAAIFTAVEVLCQFGVMPEIDDPYNVNLFENAPPNDWISGSNLPINLVRTIQRGNALHDTLDALNNGYPVLFGFVVYPELEGPDIAQSGILTMPLQDEQPIGGHCVVATGFDDTKQMITVRNQWGAQWGDHGYFHMPYAYYAHYCTEAYIIQD